MHHDDSVRRGTHLEISNDRPIRHVLEARHASFFTRESLELLSEHGIALAISDSPDWPSHDVQTTDFVYLRLHGSTQLYASSYRDDELEAWAARMRRIMKPRGRATACDVYAYFDNDAHGRAVEDALRLKALLRDVGDERGRQAAQRKGSHSVPKRV